MITRFRRLLIAIPFLLSSILSLHAQEMDLHRQCGMRSPEQPHTASASAGIIEPYGGAHLPFKGQIRGLVTFVQLRNDDVENNAWPNGSMPLWADMYVERLERYFADMSGGELQLQLDVHPSLMITRGTEEGYVTWGENFGVAIREMIDSLDVIMDFGPYDRWDSEGNPYNLKEQPDGKVDLLIVVFRSISHAGFMPFTGVSDLGFAGHHFVDGSLDRFFYGGSGQWNDAGASGLSLSYLPGRKGVMNAEFAFNVTVHELGHKLFGEAHPADLYGRLGIMARSSNGYSMSSFEKHLAGYIDYRVLNAGRDTVITLTDFVTHGDAALLPIPQHPRSYYAFEFRGKKSEWDTAPVEGLYIYRIFDSWSKSQKRLLVVSAEGSFDWALDDSTGLVYPVRARPIGGFSRMQQIPVDNRIYWAEGWNGDPRVAFRDHRKELAVFKNPSPDFIFGSDTVRTDLHIRLLALTDSTATVRISYQYPTILTTDNPVPEQSALALPFPHPTRTAVSSIVDYRISRPSFVRLRLLDALGRNVQVLDRGRKAAGTHRTVLNADGLAPGSYLMVLETGEHRLLRRILITF
ncbi:MAG: hypothetical protein RRA94_08345 [Bacteroidota bacterium]|nr:hypothetical protein [Bacteroidota bacterium]